MSDGFINEPCPFLPEIDRVWRATDVTAFGDERGAAFYHASLCYAQSQWRKGVPAQAMLQINRSLACCLKMSEMSQPLGYKPMAWLIANRREGQFIGNPVRHFQHLATRMVEPWKELRTWRAWACWYLARAMLPAADFPADMVQIRDEGVVEPTFAQIGERLRALSPADDVDRWLEALDWIKREGHAVASSHIAGVEPSFEVLPEHRLSEVTALAHEIWPQVYPGIISQEQIDYMLRWMYSPEKLTADVRERGVVYALIRSGDEVCGYVGFGPEEGTMFLHKLYLLPQKQGRGLGAAGLRWVKREASQKGFTKVKLRVNKNNHAAVRAYLRQGFVFEQDVVADIGGGFVMDDFVMSCEVGS